MRHMGWWLLVLTSLSACKQTAWEEVAANPEGFYLERWKAQSARNGSVQVSDLTATVDVTAEACLHETVTSAAMPRERVRIALSETPELPEGTPLTETDATGCARPLPSALRFPYFGQESYLRRYLVVRLESGVYSGLVRSVEVPINPWQKDDDTFFWDTRRGPVPELGAGRVALQAEEIAWQYPPQQDDLEVSADLVLTQKDVFQVQVQPQVLRSATFDKTRGPAKAETLWPGMRVRARALIAATRNPELPEAERFLHLRLLGQSEATAVVDERGKLTFPIALAYDFGERPLLETQTRLYLELSVIGGEGPATLTLEAPFDALASDGKAFSVASGDLALDSLAAQLLPKEMKLREVPLSAPKLASLGVRPNDLRLLKPVAADGKLPFDAFLNRVAQPANLRKVDLGKESVPSELSGVFSERDFARAPGLPERLCGYYFSNARPTLKECRERPGHYLRVDRFRFLETPLAQTRRLPSSSTTLQMNASFFRETSDGRTSHDGHTTSHNLDVGVTAKAGYETFGNGVTAHASYLFKNGWFQTAEHTTSTADRKRLLIQEMRTLIAEQTKVTGKARVRDCVSFRHRGWMAKGEMTEAGRAGKAYLLCRGEERQVSESWYYVSDCLPPSFFSRRNGREALDRVWLILLRGERELTKLKERFEDRDRQVEIVEAPIFSGGIDHLMNDVYRTSRDTGLLPGLLDYESL